jgi:hypothetical protein
VVIWFQASDAPIASVQAVLRRRICKSRLSLSEGCGHYQLHKALKITPSYAAFSNQPTTKSFARNTFQSNNVFLWLPKDTLLTNYDYKFIRFWQVKSGAIIA